MARTPANPWSAEDPGICETLRDATFEAGQQIAESSNYVVLAQLSHSERGRGLAVYKPARGERPLSDFPFGTLHRREVAAYEFSSLLGWDIVPPTVERGGPHGEGSMQVFIEHDPGEHYFVVRERPQFEEQLVRLAVFDLVANNADRKGGHVILDGEGKLWAIDNGLTFHPQEKLRTVIWDFEGRSIPDALLADLGRVIECVRGEADAGAPLRALISRREIDALVARTERLLAMPVLPEMYPWRCTPWPLI